MSTRLLPKAKYRLRVMDGLARHVRYMSLNVAESELKRLGWEPEVTVGLTSYSRYIYINGTMVWNDNNVLEAQ